MRSESLRILGINEDKPPEVKARAAKFLAEIGYTEQGTQDVKKSHEVVVFDPGKRSSVQANTSNFFAELYRRIGVPESDIQAQKKMLRDPERETDDVNQTAEVVLDLISEVYPDRDAARTLLSKDEIRRGETHRAAKKVYEQTERILDEQAHCDTEVNTIV